MTDDNQDLRSAHARIAALTRAATTDGAVISAPARTAFMESFSVGHECKYCPRTEIDQALPPDQRARAVQALISVHFTRLALASALARRRGNTGRDEATVLERELAEGLAQLDDE